MGSGVSTGSLLVSDVLSLRLCIMIVVVGKRRGDAVGYLSFVATYAGVCKLSLYYLYLKNKNDPINA